MGMNRTNLTRETLVMDPYVQWRMRREMIGALPTLAVDADSQAKLIAERDALLAELSSNRLGAA